MSRPLSHAEFYHALEQGHHAKLLAHLRGHPLPDPPPGGHAGSPLTALRRWEKPRAMEVMQALLAAGADPNAPDGVGRRPLHTWLWLTAAPRVAIHALLEAGADPLKISFTAPQKSLQTAPEACIYHGQPAKILWLLEAQPQLAREHDDQRADPCLLTALGHNVRVDTPWHRKLLRGLLEHGANPDLPDAFNRCARQVMVGYQLEVLDQWEGEQRAALQASALDAQVPAASLDPRRRRI